MVRFSTLGFALAAASVLVPGVLSQTVPACASSCATTAATAAGCDLTDTTCLCSNQAFATSAGQCVGSSCTPPDVQTAQAYFAALCTGTTTDNSTTSTSVPTNSTSTGPATSTSPSTTSTRSPSGSSTSPTSSTSSSSKPNHATLNQPAGVLGAGLALGLALFA